MSSKSQKQQPTLAQELLYTGMSVASFFAGVWVMKTARKWGMLIGALVYASLVFFTMVMTPFVKTLIEDGKVLTDSILPAAISGGVAVLLIFIA